VREKDALIYALDADGMDEARAWVMRLSESVGIFKIGLQLFLREGPAVVDMVHQAGNRVFLDLKFHDIPHTVSKAVAETVRMGVFMTNVHASGGKAMMEAAAKSAKEEAEGLGREPPLVLGVTVLTSMDEEALSETGMKGPPDQAVTRLAALADQSGLAGVVASPLEASSIRKAHGKNFIIVCPGVRPEGLDKEDQRRTATPAKAMAAGADCLVVGRPIRDAEDPPAAAADILRQISRAKKER